MMSKTPPLPMVTTDAILERVKNGESVYALAKEHNRHAANLYSLLKRRYGFEFRERPSYWPGRLAIPDDAGVKGYIAGIIDGEGSLKRRKDGLWTIDVVMTDESTIRWLHQFGGTFVGAYARPAPRKPIFGWRVARRYDVLTLLQAIAPYLITKRAKADEAIAELGPRIARAYQRNVVS